MWHHNSTALVSASDYRCRSKTLSQLVHNLHPEFHQVTELECHTMISCWASAVFLKPSLSSTPDVRLLSKWNKCCKIMDLLNCFKWTSPYQISKKVIQVKQTDEKMLTVHVCTSWNKACMMIELILCSTSLPLASARWVPLTSAVYKSQQNRNKF